MYASLPPFGISVGVKWVPSHMQGRLYKWRQLRYQIFREISLYSKIRSESNAIWLWSFGWLSWHVVHHIKPTQGGYLEVKGFQDWSTYSWEIYHITIYWNFWTHCRTMDFKLPCYPLTTLEPIHLVPSCCRADFTRPARGNSGWHLRGAWHDTAMWQAISPRKRPA